MCKMSALCKVHSHYSIARLKHCEIYSHVSLCSGVWLNICVFCAEELTSSLSCNILNNVNILASAVVTLARITFSILVCKQASHSCHNSRRNDVLTGDKLQVSLLSFLFQKHSFAHFRVVLVYKIYAVQDVNCHDNSSFLYVFTFSFPKKYSFT